MDDAEDAPEPSRASDDVPGLSARLTPAPGYQTRISATSPAGTGPRRGGNADREADGPFYDIRGGPQGAIRNHVRHLEALGYKVTLQPAA